MKTSTMILLMFCAFCFCEYQIHNPKITPKEPIKNNETVLIPVQKTESPQEYQNQVSTNQIDPLTAPASGSGSNRHTTDELINNINSKGL